MAADNLAAVDHYYDVDVEQGDVGIDLVPIGSSTNLLGLPPPPSDRLSLRASLHSTRHSVATCCKTLWKVVSSLKLLIIIALYSILGAYMFMWLEVPNDLATQQETYDVHLIARDTLLFSLRRINDDRMLIDRDSQWKEAILSYESAIGVELPTLESRWTFAMAMLYAGTVYTTIGYGNIVCATVAGQAATIFYAICGIPLMIIILNDLGNFLLKVVRRISDAISNIIFLIGVRTGFYKIDEANRSRIGVINRTALSLGVFSVETGSAGIIDNDDGDDQKGSAEDGDSGRQQNDAPVIASVLITISWIFLSAAMFCIWEDWTYWTSCYFIFISLSTIGFGDIVGRPDYMILAFGVVLVGLSLVSVSINVVQQKLEQVYMQMLQKLLKDYIKAVESGDTTAATQGMMSGFKGRAKFLMPLVSKNQGARVMTQLKKEAKSHGIELPAVLTDIDPETGMPAFAKAKVEDFSEYIEKANEQAQQSFDYQKNIEIQTDEWNYEQMFPSTAMQPLTMASTPNETISIQVNIPIADTDASTLTNPIDQIDIGVQIDRPTIGIDKYIQVDSFETIDTSSCTDHIEHESISTQTISEHSECTMQTDPVDIGVECECQTEVSSLTQMHDIFAQTDVIAVDQSTIDCQTIVIDYVDASDQCIVEMITNGSQSYYSLFSSCESQTMQTDECTTEDQSIQNSIEVMSIGSMAIVQMTNVPMQTTIVDMVDCGVQPNVSTIYVPPSSTIEENLQTTQEEEWNYVNDIDVQTIDIELESVECQTIEIVIHESPILNDAENQTEIMIDQMNNVEIQTISENDRIDCAMQTQKISSFSRVCQTRVCSFVLVEEDAKPVTRSKRKKKMLEQIENQPQIIDIAPTSIDIEEIYDDDDNIEDVVTIGTKMKQYSPSYRSTVTGNETMRNNRKGRLTKIDEGSTEEVVENISQFKSDDDLGSSTIELINHELEKNEDGDWKSTDESIRPEKTAHIMENVDNILADKTIISTNRQRSLRSTMHDTITGRSIFTADEYDVTYDDHHYQSPPEPLDDDYDDSDDEDEPVFFLKHSQAQTDVCGFYVQQLSSDSLCDDDDNDVDDADIRYQRDRMVQTLSSSFYQTVDIPSIITDQQQSICNFLNDTSIQTDTNDLIDSITQTNLIENMHVSAQICVDCSNDYTQTDEQRRHQSTSFAQTYPLPTLEHREVQCTRIGRKVSKTSIDTQTKQVHTVDIDVQYDRTPTKNRHVQVHLVDLDEQRRLAMHDVGIQTGVLARVQQMYHHRDDAPTPPVSTHLLELNRQRLRNVTSKPTEPIITPSERWRQLVDKTIGRTTDEQQPNSSNTTSSTSKQQMVEKRRQDKKDVSRITAPISSTVHDRYWERQEIVNDLRSRIERRVTQSPAVESGQHESGTDDEDDDK